MLFSGRLAPASGKHPVDTGPEGRTQVLLPPPEEQPQNIGERMHLPESGDLPPEEVDGNLVTRLLHEIGQGLPILVVRGTTMDRHKRA